MARSNETPSPTVEKDPDNKISTDHNEVPLPPTGHRWKLSNKSDDGDVALKLFSTLDDLHEPIDPAEEAKLVRKIDWMILPYLGVCYVCYHI